MKKHPEKYWMGTMAVLLVVFLAALFENVFFTAHATPAVVLTEKVVSVPIETKGVDKAFSTFSENTKRQPATTSQTATSN